MRASYNWLKELTGIDAPPEQVAERLTAAGLEVEGIEHYGRDLDRVVVAEVRGSRAHPKRDKLSLVTVFDGEAEHEVVCGAPNVPGPGGKVLFARLGAELPGGMRIEQRKIGGVPSSGMICSEVELDLGPDAEGIFVFGDAQTPRVGQPIAETLGLRETIFEIGLTPNRPDCLGHIGIARELAVLFERPLSPPSIDAPGALAAPQPDPWAEGAAGLSLRDRWHGSHDPSTEQVPADGLGPVSVHIEDPDRCPRYGAALVLGVRVGPSPFWLRHRLYRLGVRPLSNVVDITNLVLLEWGHPIHGFDLERLRGQRIVVRRARPGEQMTTLDEVQRSFTDDDLLICDAEGPVAVAGVIGGADSEIGEQTRHVLIECAYFDPRSVRRTSRRLGAHTESSHRFERGVDPGAVPAVLARASALMQQLCGGAAVPDAIDAHPQPVQRKTIVLRPARAGALLGEPVSAGEARAVLERLGCELATDDSGQALQVTAPSWRPDLGREVDLIEELARVRGYDRIPTVVPRLHPSEHGTPAIIGFERRVRSLGSAASLHEVVSYAFVARRELELARAGLPAVPLANPLSEERAVMRTSLLPGVAAAARHAQRRQLERIRIFELGRTYHPDDGASLPRERRVLAVMLVGPRPQWIGEGAAMDFYDGKGTVEAIVEPLVGATPETVLGPELDARAPFLHPRRRALVRAGAIDVGVLGELHPDVVEALELTGRPIYAELDVEQLQRAAQRVGLPRARPLPRYPAVTRDIAMVVADAHPAGDIAAALAQAAGGLVEDVALFDLYRGKPVPEGHKSLAYRIVYRDPEATLTDARVDEVHRRVARAAEERFGASLRG